MNPNSQYYLSFDVGYPNEFDRSYGRTGDSIMVHGGCSSAGCYAMTEYQMREIYALARDAFRGGQDGFQVQALPFRMTEVNMLRHAMNPNMPFWRNLKAGSDQFEKTMAEPRVGVAKRQYVFLPATAAPVTMVAQAAPPAPVVPEKSKSPLAFLRRW
jgi:murein L,D-transpeptidase YafK